MGESRNSNLSAVGARAKEGKRGGGGEKSPPPFGKFNMALSRANCALKENAEGEGNENVPSYQNEMRGFF